MLRIPCPFCGERDHTEFSYGGDASVEYPPIDSADETAWFEAVFLREDPRGPHKELWQHNNGCRMWIVVERDTMTHEIFSAEPAHPGAKAQLAKEAGT
jgi:sarcosine oxidase subunit delta